MLRSLLEEQPSGLLRKLYQSGDSRSFKKGAEMAIPLNTKQNKTNKSQNSLKQITSIPLGI